MERMLGISGAIDALLKEPVGLRCSKAKHRFDLTRRERGQILTISTRISGISKEKTVKYGPLSHRCSRIILSPTGS